jgi:hypothetical protein
MLHLNQTSNIAAAHQPTWALAVLVLLGILTACQQKAAPAADATKLAAAQQAAQHEVEQAQIEAKKDIKSEAKIMGADSKDVARAKVTGAFDVAMARADGDNKVALVRCLMLEAAAQKTCQENANADYASAVAKAKANRATQQP